MSILISMGEMLKAGVHYGHRKSRWHPKMKQYIYGVKNNIHVMDLNKSVIRFAESLSFLKNMAAQGKTILLVGTKAQASSIIHDAAEKCDMPYVVNRWLGGTLTNFSTIKNRIKYLKTLESKKESGDIEVYTKREILEFTRQIEKMNTTLGGIKKLTKLPDVLFITDIRRDNIAVKEAKVLGISLVGIADSNNNPDELDYIIPGNDDSIKSLQYIFTKVAEAINEGKAHPIQVEKPKDEKKNDGKQVVKGGESTEKKEIKDVKKEDKKSK